MEKTDAYVVLTNGTINIVTTDPNVADQAKAKNPGSIVKRFPLTSKMAGGTGLVGEALNGDFEMGTEDGGSIGQDDVEFATDDQPSDDIGADDMGDEDMGDAENDDTSDVICMNTELAVRVFEYIAQNQIEGEELQAMADKMADLGNQSDDVLTADHFDQITGEGGDDLGGDDEFQSDDEFASDDGIDADDGVEDMTGDEQVADDLEIGEADELLRRTGQSMVNKHPRPGQTDLRNIPAGNYPGSQQRFSDEDRRRHSGQVKASIKRALGTHTRPNLPEDAFSGDEEEFDIDGLSMGDEDTSDMGMDGDFGGDESQIEINTQDEQLIQQFMSGEISKEEFIERLQQSIDGGDGECVDGEPCDDDEFADDDSMGADDGFMGDDEFEECNNMVGEDAPQQQGGQPQQNPAQFDGAYMQGYNTAQRGGQAQQQNINTPQGAAYNRGFMDAKAGKTATPPSKQQQESSFTRGSAAMDREAENAFSRARAQRRADADEEWALSKGSPRNSQQRASDRDEQWALSHRRRTNESVETFGSFLKGLESKSERVVPTVASLFKAKKQKAAEPEVEQHSTIVQDEKLVP